MMTISMDRTTPCTHCWRVPAETLIQAAAYTAFNEHDHVNVSKQLKIYTSMF